MNKRLWALSGAVAGALSGAAAGALVQKRRQAQALSPLEESEEKYFAYYQLLNQWLVNRDNGKRAETFFQEEQISTIAIYGMGDLANRLADELQGGPVRVLFGIDRDVCCTNSRIAEVYAPEDTLPEADAIVITPFTAAKQIGEVLRQRCSCRLVPLDEIIYSL